MDKYAVLVLLLIFFAGALFGSNVLNKYIREKEVNEIKSRYEYNYDYCPYCGEKLVD